jgi:tocopherol O-methyltransferase
VRAHARNLPFCHYIRSVLWESLDLAAEPEVTRLAPVGDVPAVPGATLAGATVPGATVPQREGAVSSYYHGKTAAIIDRYGPGPAIHYHIGLFDECGLAPGGTPEEIRATIVAAQERMLEHAASIWDAATAFTGNLLDVGCGLGGGSIYWAQHFPVQVTALTNVAEHAEVIRGFTAAAGVADRVHPLVTDVADLRSACRYTAAVAVESSCYVPRPRLFRRVAAALEPGGVFGIEDIFLARPDWRADFDGYWKTRIGTVSQYRLAAGRAGLLMDQNTDVTARTVEFWTHSAEWARASLDEPAAAVHRERLIRSICWHSRFLQGWRDGAYQVRILRFRKPLAGQTDTPGEMLS